MFGGGLSATNFVSNLNFEIHKSNPEKHERHHPLETNITVLQQAKHLISKD